MAESTFIFKNGTVVDLHYLISIITEGTTHWIHLHYQLANNPMDIYVSCNSREEYEEEMANFRLAWENYKQKNNKNEN